MAGLGMLINKVVEGKIKGIHTLLLAEIVGTNPIAVAPLFGGKSKIENPMILDEKIFKNGDTVLVGVLEEFAEGGRIRRFELSDAIIIGKVSNL